MSHVKGAVHHLISVCICRNAFNLKFALPTMEQKPEEFVENETAGRDCNIPMSNIPTNPIDSPESSSFMRYDTANQYSCNRTEMALIDPPSIRSLYLRNDPGLRFEEAIASNIGNHNVYDAGCSSSKEEIKHDGKWSSSIEWRRQRSRTAGEDINKDSLEVCSRKELKRVLTSLQDVKVSSSNEKNTDSTVSTNVTEGSNNISSSNIEGTSASSFSNFFLGRFRNAKRKSISYESPIASNQLQTPSMVQHNSCITLTRQNENVNSYTSGEAYDALMSRDSLSRQLYSHDISRGELESPYPGINLREWLGSKGVTASKNEKMLLFRKIVEIVNAAHSQGIVLLELQPSSFYLFETGDVKYIGSLMAVESWSVNQDNVKKRCLEPENSSHDNFRAKMQNLGGDKFLRPESHMISNQKVQDFSIYEDIFSGKSWLTSQNAQLEKEWYAFPKDFKAGDLLSLNIYSLGLLLFEVRKCSFI